MTKRVTLLRHAKSDHHGLSLSDHDRPLNARGERDATIMGRRLARNGVRPSLILTSTAMRARQTVRLFAQSIGYPVEFVQSERKLYLAEPATILDVIACQDDTFFDIIICGHNPGFTELAYTLGRTPIDNVPTCGMVTLDTDIESWGQVYEAGWTLFAFDYPKKPSTA